MEIPERVLERVRANRMTGGRPYYEVRGEDECWPVLTGLAGGSPGRKYGIIGWGSGGGKGQTSLHRVVYIAFHGPIPEGREDVAHICGNSLCANPSHLAAKTHADNNRDMLAHGTHVNSYKTHCVRGHLFSEENTLYRKDGKFGRNCRICMKIRRDPGYERVYKDHRCSE